MAHLFDVLKRGYVINKSVDFSSKAMSLDTAKDVLRHCTEVNNETIQFSEATWGLICGDTTAIDLLEEAYSKGWNSNEPDIQIVANSGYNGQVFYNGVVQQLTQSTTNTDVWYKMNAGTVTSLEDFSQSDVNTTNVYNSTSSNIKIARFGKNINTNSCTSCHNLFHYEGTNCAALEKLDVRHLKTQNVTSFRHMFADFNTGSPVGPLLVGLENIDSSSGTDFHWAFSCHHIRNKYLDLHTWRIQSSADVTSMFCTLSANTGYGLNYAIFYTPEYWKATTAFATIRMPLAPYPYHQFNVVGNSSYAGLLRVNDASVTMTKDNTLGIWYYDLPAGQEVTSLSYIGNASSYADQGNILSLSINENTPVASSINMNMSFVGNANIQTAHFGPKLNVKVMHQFFNMGSSGTSTVYSVTGLDKMTFDSSSVDRGNAWFQGCNQIRYVDLPLATVNYTNAAFSRCTNLIRIKNYPKQNSASVNQSNNPLASCTSLTTVDNWGNQYKGLDLRNSPLTAASINKLFNACQTVEDERIHLGTTTSDACIANNSVINRFYSTSSSDIRMKGWTPYLNYRMYGKRSTTASFKLRLNKSSYNSTSGGTEITITPNSNGIWKWTGTTSLTSLAGLFWNIDSNFVWIGMGPTIAATNVTKLNRTFMRYESNLKFLDLFWLSTSKVTDCGWMLEGRSGILKTLDTRNISTANCTGSNSLKSMYYQSPACSIIRMDKYKSNSSTNNPGITNRSGLIIYYNSTLWTPSGLGSVTFRRVN